MESSAEKAQRWTDKRLRPLSDKMAGSQRPSLISESGFSEVRPTRGAAGSAIFRAADETGSVFAVVVGQLELHLTLQGRDPTLTHIYGPGAWLGNTAAMTGRRRRITAVAGANGCHTLQLSSAEIGRIAERDPKASRYFADLHARTILIVLEVIDAQ